MAFTAFADTHFVKAHSILSNGKILHKEVHYQKLSELFHDEYDFVHANQIISIQYVVVHRNSFYECLVRHAEDIKTNTPYLDSVDCRLLRENRTWVKK